MAEEIQEDKTAEDLIEAVAANIHRLEAFLKRSPTRMVSASDLKSILGDIVGAMRGMREEYFAYTDAMSQSLQDAGIGSEAIRPFLTLTEQVLFAQSKLVLATFKNVGFLTDTGLSSKVPQELSAMFSECDKMVSDWVIKRDALLAHLAELEAAEEEEEDEEDEDEDEGDEGEEEVAETATAAPAPAPVVVPSAAGGVAP